MEITLYKFLIIFVLGVLVHFVLIFVKWNNTKKLIEELKLKQIKSLLNLRYKEISISSGGWFHKFNLGLSATNIDLIFTKNQIHFLPSKFSFFLYGSMLPFDINKRLDVLELTYQRDKIIFFYSVSNYEHGEVFNKISISGTQMQIGELKEYLDKWMHNS